MHYIERSEGQLHKRLFHERAFTLTYLQQTTQSSTSFVSAKLLMWSKTVPDNFTE